MASDAERDDSGTEPVSGFFPLSPGDIAYVVAVLAFAVVAFLPWARDISFAGVALIGWLMATLMVAAPLIALVRIASEKRPTKHGDER